MVAARKPAAVDNSLLAAMWTRDLGRQHGFEPLRVEGTLPRQLRGTLYRNGPGQFGQFGTRYSHPFEGDGATTAIRIADGVAHGASKLHDTQGLVEERAAGKLLYGLSTSWPRRVRNTLRGTDKNTANTNIVSWQGRLFALMEAGKPTEIAPADLRTIGATDLGGVVRGFFSAHPHRVQSRKALYNFGLEYGRVTKLHTYELPDAGNARRLGTIELAGPPMLHDFIATDTHLIFFVSPVRIDVVRMLLSIGSFDKLFRWRPEHGTEVICVPIDAPDRPVRFQTDAFYQWHFANAFTRDTSTLVVDYVRYRGFDSFHQFGELLASGDVPGGVDVGTYHRATIDLATRKLRSEQVSDRSCEFPTLTPGTEGREHERAFVVLDELAAIGSIDSKGTIVSHTVPADVRATEPLYADGCVLSLCHMHDRAFVAVYDAQRLPDGPVAKIWIDHFVPITFHGTFVGK